MPLIKIDPIDIPKATKLMLLNEEIDIDDYTWLTPSTIMVPDGQDYLEVWNQIMILFESENIKLL